MIFIFSCWSIRCHKMMRIFFEKLSLWLLVIFVTSNWFFFLSHCFLFRGGAWHEVPLPQRDRLRPGDEGVREAWRGQLCRIRAVLSPQPWAVPSSQSCWLWLVRHRSLYSINTNSPITAFENKQKRQRLDSEKNSTKTFKRNNNELEIYT